MPISEDELEKLLKKLMEDETLDLDKLCVEAKYGLFPYLAAAVSKYMAEYKGPHMLMLPNLMTGTLKMFSALSSWIGDSGGMDISQYNNHVDTMLEMMSKAMKGDYERILRIKLEQAVKKEKDE